MPATLKRVGDELHLSLSGHPNFAQALETAKNIFPREWDGDAKVWKYPATEDMALRVMYAVGPQPDAAILEWVRGAAGRIADDLAAQLPKDAELYWQEGPRLYQFQRPMVDIMARQERYLNGDDMGLGKTIESIGAIQEWIARVTSEAGIPSFHHDEDNRRRLAATLAPKLVIAGTSKLGDWRDEIKAWTGGKRDPETDEWIGGDNVIVIPGDLAAGKRATSMRDFEFAHLADGSWLVINHEQIRALPEDKDKKARDQEWTLKTPWYGEQDWLAVIADEAHRFKNPFAQQTRGLWSIHGRLQYPLTGTPIINAPPDIWPLLAWLFPTEYNERGGGATTYWQFERRYAEGYSIPGRSRVNIGVKNGDDLRMELSNKMGRRSKSLLVKLGILPKKLPTKTRLVQMRKGQAKLYREAERSFWLEVEQDVEHLRERARSSDPADKPSEAAAILERVEAAAERGESPGRIAKWLPNAGVKYSILRQIATSPGLLGAKDESGKLDAVVEDILDAGDKQFVAFTWHREAAELLAHRLNKAKIKAVWMHGGTKQLERTEVVRRFEDGETQILVSTIKTGGEGLNLVGTDMPLFVELSDSIAVNDQGEDRTWRIGQKQEVQPVRYLTEGTVEVDRQEPRLRMKAIMQGATIGRDRD